VGRSHQVSLVFAATLGLSGCTWFENSVNKAPVVKISTDATTIYRNTRVTFVATVTDDHDSAPALRLRWLLFTPVGDQQTCRPAWPSTQPPNVSDPLTYPFQPPTLETSCLCAQVFDTQGATGQDCYRIAPANVAPKVVITDDSGAQSNQERSLCSQIRLSAGGYPAEDQIRFQWAIEYQGSTPSGRSVQLQPCEGVTASPDAHRCFNTGARGTYTVTLRIEDTPPGTTAATPAQADPFVIPVRDDTPPCILRTEPEVYAQRILLSRGTDLGGSYQSRTFKALSVDDDCEPYPMVTGSTGSTYFAWSVMDMTRPSDAGAASWVPQTDNTASFTVSQAQFPNARPGDAVKVRLEVRDTRVVSDYQDPSYSPCHDLPDICRDSSSSSTGAKDCVRWTTWTVQFQP
jgi:hypothetical protein